MRSSLAFLAAVVSSKVDDSSRMISPLGPTLTCGTGRFESSSAATAGSSASERTRGAGAARAGGGGEDVGSSAFSSAFMV